MGDFYLNTKNADVKNSALTDDTNNMQVTKEQINKAAWRAVDVLKDRFALSLNDVQVILGGIALADLEEGLATESLELDDDALQRVSALLAIYKRLRLLFDREEQAYAWIDRSNSHDPFNGMTPRSVMLSGHYADLLAVATFLESFTWLAKADDLHE